MSPEAIITTEQAQGRSPVTILHIQGGLDLKSEGSFFQKANGAYEQGARLLVVDLAEVDRITSAGMRALTAVYKLFTPEAEQEKVVHIRMCGGQAHIMHVLDITGFLKRIPHHDNVQAAVAAFNA